MSAEDAVPADQRGVVVQGVCPAWVQEDITKYFTVREGCIERLTYFPRKALALMTLATVGDMKAVLALNNSTPPGAQGPLTVTVTERKASVNTDGMNKGKRRNRGKNEPQAEKRPLEEQKEEAEAPAVSEPLIVKQAEVADVGEGKLVSAVEEEVPKLEAPAAPEAEEVPAVPEGDLPVMPKRKKARKEKAKKQRESLLSFIDEP